MKKSLRILALVLALMLSVGVLSGCGQKKMSREKGKYSYWASVIPTASETLLGYDDMLMYQELEKRTGIEIEFIHPISGSNGSETFNVLLASDDMPDMVEYDWTKYPGGPDKAIENGVIISLNDYMAEYAPNYYSYMEGDKAEENGYRYKVQSVSEQGNYYGFKNLNIGTRRGFSGLIIRKDLLDKWGLDVPVTIDDWTKIFEVAKANGIKKPLTGDSTLFSLSGCELFETAWNVGRDFYIEDDKIVLAFDKPGYKSYLTKMADWYKKGYIDPDYITNDTATIQGNMTNGDSIACFGYIGGTIGVLLSAMETRDPNYSVVACPFPVLKEGDIPWFQEVQSESAEPTIAITHQCGEKDEERYKEAIGWCDYLYSEEGKILKSFGVKGKTYEEVVQSDGTVKYEYLITTPEEIQKAGATSIAAALWHYMRPANSPGLNQHDDYLSGFYPNEEQVEALEVWNKYVDEAKKHVMPTLAYNDEEITRMRQINTECKDSLDSTISSVISNEKGIEAFQNAVDKAKKDGYDELLKIHQTAYDRYLEKLK